MPNVDMNRREIYERETREPHVSDTPARTDISARPVYHAHRRGRGNRAAPVIRDITPEEAPVDHETRRQQRSFARAQRSHLYSGRAGLELHSATRFHRSPMTQLPVIEVSADEHGKYATAFHGVH